MQRLRLTLLIALTALGVSLSALLAALGLASVGLGFALRDIIGTTFAGIVQCASAG